MAASNDNWIIRPTHRWGRRKHDLLLPIGDTVSYSERGTFTTVVGLAGSGWVGWWVVPTTRAGRRAVRGSSLWLLVLCWLRYRSLGQAAVVRLSGEECF